MHMIDAGHGAHVHRELDRVRHRIGIEAAVNGCNIHRRLAHEGVTVDPAVMLPVEMFKVINHLVHLENRVDALLRHRRMRRLSGGLDFHPQQAAMADTRIVGGGFGNDDGTRAIKHFLLGQILGALAADLFARGQHQGDTGRIFQQWRQLQSRDHERGDAAFHIAHAAAIDTIAIGRPGKGIARPRCHAQRHHIEMTGKTNRRLVLLAADSGHDTGAGIGELVVADTETAILQQFAKSARAIALDARGIDGVEMQQLAGELSGVVSGHCGLRQFDQAAS